MSILSAEMAFEIGDIVYRKGVAHVPGVIPVGFVVAERFVQECHGGVQRLYKVFGDNMKLIDGVCPEICLTKEMPPMDISFYRAARFAEREVDRAGWDLIKPDPK